MLSRVTIRRLAGQRTQDQYGQDVDEYVVIATNVPFRLDNGVGAATSRVVRVGEQEFETATAVGHLPARLVDDLRYQKHDRLLDGDWIDIVEGESAGHTFRIVEALFADLKTALRVPVYEVDRPKEW